MWRSMGGLRTVVEAVDVGLAFVRVWVCSGGLAWQLMGVSGQ